VGATAAGRLFLSFDPAETGVLAARLSGRLADDGFAVCCDPERTLEQSAPRIRSSDALVAILSPAATDRADRLCLQELHLARFGDPSRPIVPVMAIACEVPLTIILLHYVDMQGWEHSQDVFESGLTQLLIAARQLADD
jgi:TIR domain